MPLRKIDYMQRLLIRYWKRWLTCTTLGLAAVVATPMTFAQNHTFGYPERIAVNLNQPQKLKFYFVMGSSDLVFQYGPNLMQRQQFDSLAKRVALMQGAAIDSVVMVAYTSPTESQIGSIELAEARLVSVKDYVIRTLEHNELEGIPVLSHIRSAEAPDLEPEIVGPTDDPWLAGNDIYNKVRRVDFVAYLNAANAYDPATQMQAQFNVTSELTQLMSDTLSESQRIRQEQAYVTNPYPVWQPRTVARRANDNMKSLVERERYTGPINQIMSLRTNLLYWLMFAPNGGIEFHIGSHFSILAEGAITYWNKKTDTGDKGIYVAGGGPEFRYWFNDDRSEPGHVIGIYGQYADFDIKLNEKGRQGTSIGGGISYGYYLPVGRRWAFEFGIGIGYLSNKTDVYKWNPIVKKNLWVEYNTKPWIGPTKARVTAIFRIGHK